MCRHRRKLGPTGSNRLYLFFFPLKLHYVVVVVTLERNKPRQIVLKYYEPRVAASCVRWKSNDARIWGGGGCYRGICPPPTTVKYLPMYFDGRKKMILRNIKNVNISPIFLNTYHFLTFRTAFCRFRILLLVYIFFFFIFYDENPLHFNS